VNAMLRLSGTLSGSGSLGRVECRCRPAYAPQHVVAIHRYRCILTTFSSSGRARSDDLHLGSGMKGHDLSVG
jgi:hypothetical protein